MPIGAAIGGAAIAGGGAIIAGSKAASAQKSAANQAAQTAADTTAENNALFREIYGQNTALGAPLYNNGLLASNALTDLLLGTHTFNPGILAHPTVPGGGTFPQFPVGPNGGAAAPAQPPYTAAQIAAMRNDGIPKNAAQAEAANAAWYASHANGAATPSTPAVPAGAPTTSALAGYGGTSGITSMRAAPANGALAASERVAPSALSAYSTPPVRATATGTPAVPAAGGTATPPAAGTPATAQSAWDAFRNSTNYTFRLNEGQNALNSKFAANGMFDSGAADKALLKYSQNYASNELGNYMNLLAGQQSLGANTAGAIMGVGNVMGSNVAAQNTAAANAAANAALANGQANAGLWGTIGNVAGQVGGALFQYGTGGFPGMSAGAAGSQGYNVSPTGGSNYFAAHPFG